MLTNRMVKVSPQLYRDILQSIGVQLPSQYNKLLDGIVDYVKIDIAPMSTNSEYWKVNVDSGKFEEDTNNEEI